MAKNEMLTFIKELKGNPKACIMTEPLWYIPFNLYSPFASVYMYKLGVSDFEIGVILSVGMIFQVLLALIGGIVTDKLGRRLTTLLADIMSWTVPCIIWGLSQNFWWFLVAAVFNSFNMISEIAWSSLFVEDCPDDKLVYAYSWINIAGSACIVIMPLSYFLMQSFDTVFVMRCLYIYSAISMTAKFVSLYLLSRETKNGIKRMAETKNVPVTKLFTGYKDVFIKIFTSREMITALFIMLSYNITNTISGTFFGLYTTDTLGIDESFLAVFQMITTLVSIIMMFTVQGKLNKLPFVPVMIFGYILFIGNNLLLIFCPQSHVVMIYLYSIINAIAIACVSPRKDSLAFQFIDKKERSRVMALMSMIMIAVTSPFGAFTGYLSEVNRTYPFILAILIFVITSVVILVSKSVKKLDKKEKYE